VYVFETISAEFRRDATLTSASLQGEIAFAAVTDIARRPVISVAPLSALAEQGWNFKLSPFIDRGAALTDDPAVSLLRRRDAPTSPGFVAGVESYHQLVRYRQALDSATVPITVSVWISTSNGTTTVAVEYEASLDSISRFDAEVVVPLPAGTAGQAVLSAARGLVRADEAASAVRWSFSVDTAEMETTNGVLDIELPECREDDLYPVSVGIDGPSTLLPLDIFSAAAESGDPLRFEVRRSIQTEGYIVP
jgi:hypothetical protein